MSATWRSEDDVVDGTAGPVRVGDLLARVAVVEPGIVLLREAPNGTHETYSVLLERARELGATFPAYSLVVDLRDANERPKGRYLELIRSSSTGPVHVAMNQPGGAVLRAALRFIVGGFSRNASTHVTLDEALEAAREALARATADNSASEVNR